MILLFEDLKNVLKVDFIVLQEPWKNQRDLTTYHLFKQNFELIYLSFIKTKVCFYMIKSIAFLSLTYTHHFADHITLHLLTTNQQKTHIHNIYNQIKLGIRHLAYWKNLKKSCWSTPGTKINI